MKASMATVSVPSELADLLDPSGAGLDVRVREALVLYLFQQEVISSGKGAELLGISMDAFRELQQRLGIPYFRQTPEELMEDLRVAEAARKSRAR